jgi:hypothetical protein
MFQNSLLPLRIFPKIKNDCNALKNLQINGFVEVNACVVEEI